MSRNGSGVYSLPAGNPVVTGTTISSSWANTTLSDIATALTGSVAADGQTAMTGNLQMGNNKITGLAVATSSGDALSYGQAATVSSLTVSGAFAANGGATLGDASGDALTINSSAVSIPNGLNFDSNTLVIDATNNRVGVGTASPAYSLDVNAATADATQITKTAADGYFTQYKEATTLVGYIYSSTGSSNPFRVGAGGSKPLTLEANGVERMRIDSSGNVGIGTSSTAARLHVAGTGNQQVLIQSTNGNSSSIQLLSSGVTAWNLENSTNALKFLQDGSERMRIDSSGNLLVGTTTSAAKVTVTANSGDILNLNTNSTNTGYLYNSSSATTSDAAYFIKNNANVGRIVCSSSSTTYSTSSDYRLKENISPMTGALAKVQALKPCTYTWKSTGEASQGFIAHELQEVVPDCVIGEKDAVDKDGKPLYQGIDTSFLVATLTAALQEAHGLIKDLQARVEALESK
jgi:hypothetical protein